MQTANVMNDRPLGVRVDHKNEGDLMPDNRYKDEPVNYVKSNKILTAWWDLWYNRVFLSFFPITKWKNNTPTSKLGTSVL